MYFVEYRMCSDLDNQNTVDEKFWFKDISIGPLGLQAEFSLKVVFWQPLLVNLDILHFGCLSFSPSSLLCVHVTKVTV